MVKDRLIFSLLMDDGTYMLGRNFKLQKVGNLKWIIDNYDADSILYSIDELIVLNVARQDKNIKVFSKHLEELTKHCFMPVAAGGGISSMEDAYEVINAGADKIIINTILITDQQLVKDLVKVFGSQCIVASIDYKKEQDTIKTFIKNGSLDSKLDLYEALDNAIELGVGEIYLNSIAREGTGQGLDIQTVKEVSEKSKIPIIAAGGIERTDQFYEGIKESSVQAVAASDLLYFMGDSLSKARENMSLNGCNMAAWGTLSDFTKLQYKKI
ncbi:MAG: HisA/HisF-related TIM barrel protein [Aliarcobacter butzleri]|nr:HisA/HisF-related TIM barrel protein [Aliarcobacter butzleri]